jgi:hypothetical protein
LFPCRPPELVITLLPYVSTGTITSVEITQMPALGLLYQTSLNFELYGYNPTRTVQITSVPTVVTSPTYRIVYIPPPNFVATFFKYKVTPSVGLPRTGQVTLTAPDLVTMASPFWTSNEGWTVQTAVNTNSTWSPTSTSTSLNYFVFGGDFDPVVGQNNNVRWYFIAPPKFLGNYGYIYNGFLQFWLGSFAGDFANTAIATPYNLIELWCSSCGSGGGITLAQRYQPYNGGLQFFNFTMNEYATSGWFQDPKNGLVTVWPSPTQCDFIHVLMGLTEIRVYGDVTTSFEVVGLDSFTFVVGPSNGVPVGCYY